MMSANAMKPKKIAVSQVQAIHANLVAISFQVSATHSNIRAPPSNAAKGKALGNMIAYKPDDDSTWDHGQDAGGCEQGPVHSRRRIAASHHGSEGKGIGCRERGGEQLLDPGKHEEEECRHADPVGDQRQEYPDEEVRKGITVDCRRFVDLARNAANETFENPDRQRDIEETMRQRHRPNGVEQADRVIEIG